MALIVLIFFLSLFPTPVFANAPPDLAHSSLSVSSVVPADGQTPVTVTVTLKNTSNNPVTGDTVTLKDPDDGSAVITPASTTTDGAGIAVFKIISIYPGTYQLNITDTTANTPLNGLGNVIFNPTSGNYPCTNPAPGSTPKLSLAQQISASQITLSWTKSSDPVSHYLVAYGISSGQYQYGNPRIGGRNVTAFTIDALSPNTKYYFIIKAVNGCMPGNNSNELSETTLPKGKIITVSAPIPTIKVQPNPTITSSKSAETIIKPTLALTLTAIPLQITPIALSSNKAEINAFVIGLVIAFVILGVVSYWYFRVRKRNPPKIFDKNHPLIIPKSKENKENGDI